MSISIYYTARRGEPLTPEEQAAVEALRASYSIRAIVARYVQTGRGHNGEDFCIYDPDNRAEPGIIFEGATKLPDTSEDATAALVEHWCKLLTEVRRAVPSAEWHVHVDDCDIPWDEETQEYDTTA